MSVKCLRIHRPPDASVVARLKWIWWEKILCEKSPAAMDQNSHTYMERKLIELENAPGSIVSKCCMSSNILCWWKWMDKDIRGIREKCWRRWRLTHPATTNHIFWAPWFAVAWVLHWKRPTAAFPHEGAAVFVVRRILHIDIPAPTIKSNTIYRIMVNLFER